MSQDLIGGEGMPTEGPKEFVIYLQLPPKAWARARTNGKRFFTDPSMRAHKEQVAYLAKAQYLFQPLKGGVVCEMTFSFPKPEKPKHKTFHIVRPDLDNLVKQIGDALNKICWEDDCQLCELRVRKVYALDGKAPGIEIRFREV